MLAVSLQASTFLQLSGPAGLQQRVMSVTPWPCPGQELEMPLRGLAQTESPQARLLKGCWGAGPACHLVWYGLQASLLQDWYDKSYRNQLAASDV